MKTDRIFYGAAYYDEYLPCDRIDEDMRLMKDAGMNTIRIAESTWSTLEPQEGKFDFTHLERMLSKAEEYGISVIVGTPTYAFPAWLARKAPDILAVTHSGKETYGRRQNMDITNPHYLFYAERIVRKLLSYCADRPCVIGYQIDNETSPYDTAGPNVQEAFVSYLKERFSDLDALNREFGLDYWSNRIDDWADFPDVRGTINGSLHAEFRKFQRLLVADFHNRLITIVKEYARPDQFITHNFDYGWNGFSHGIKPDVNQFECAKNMTVAGTDIYHPCAGALTGAEISFGGNLTRSLKRGNYLVLETQAQGNTGWLPYPGQLRLQAFSHIACGANSVLYWHWHSIHNAIESYWKGVLSHNLKPNATYRECCIIGAEFAKYGDRVQNLSKKCEVAVMIDNESLTALEEFPINGLSYNDILLWVTDALYRVNIEYDVLTQDADESLLAQYKMIVVPAMYSASEQIITRINHYVEQGGHCIMTFKSCFADRCLKIYHDDAPHRLTACFGMTYDQFTVDTPNLTRTCFDADNASVGKFMELLIPGPDTNVLAAYDRPAYNGYAAVTEHVFGAGTAVYIGCYFDRAHLSDLFLRQCGRSGVALCPHRFPLVCKRGVNEAGRSVVFYLNYSETEQTVVSEWDCLDLLSDVSRKKGESVTLAPWGVLILEV